MACNSIYCSSMARYGCNELPFHEALEPKPQDPYGIAKVAAEQVLKNLCGVHGVDFVIAVPHNIIGPRQKYDDPYRNVASITRGVSHTAAFRSVLEAGKLYQLMNGVSPLRCGLDWGRRLMN